MRRPDKTGKSHTLSVKAVYEIVYLSAIWIDAIKLMRLSLSFYLFSFFRLQIFGRTSDVTVRFWVYFRASAFAHFLIMMWFDRLHLARLSSGKRMLFGSNMWSVTVKSLTQRFWYLIIVNETWSFFNQSIRSAFIHMILIQTTEIQEWCKYDKWFIYRIERLHSKKNRITPDETMRRVLQITPNYVNWRSLTGPIENSV